MWQLLFFVLAERVGFEPTVTRKGYNGFRDRPNRPLWHLSINRPNYSRECAKFPRRFSARGK